jgi:hypothetical protein
MTPDQHIWACALAIERLYGLRAPVHIAERIGMLALAGDQEGVARWQAIAARLDALRGSGAISARGKTGKGGRE